MPKIKAYKGNGSVIPLDEAQVGTAYRCPWTNKVYAYKQDYVSHLMSYRINRIRHKNRVLKRHKILTKLWNLDDWNKVIEWFNSNSDFMLENGFRRNYDEETAETLRGKFKFEITYLKMEWYPNVSNTHDCPHNGETNWGGRDTFKDGTPKPRGYPGWNGRIEFKMSHDIGFGSDIFRGMRVNTGGGGGIRKINGYEVRLFDADWPTMAKQTNQNYEQHISESVMDRLADRYTPGFKQVFLYGEPDYFKR